VKYRGKDLVDGFFLAAAEPQDLHGRTHMLEILQVVLRLDLTAASLE
jgi:hypothetical protein